jgi:hypothetical protein
MALLLALALLANEAHAQTPARSLHLVSQADMDRWKTELSNWGRWGPDDQRGHAEPDHARKRRQAAALVRDGFAVSLARRRRHRAGPVDNNSP